MKDTAAPVVADSCGPGCESRTADAEEFPSCSISGAELERQLERHARLGRQATRLERREESFVLEFGADLDRELLEETLAVERECCPFFSFGFLEEERTLTVAVKRGEHAPALEALAEALAPVAV